MVAKKPKLTIKQAKFVKAKSEGKTGVQAAMEAYDTTNYSTANAIAVENLQKPSIQEAVQHEMARQGIDLESIVKPIADGLVAEKVSIVGNGEAAMAEITPDHSIRLKSSAMAQQLIGLNKGSEGGVNVHFHQHQAEQKAKYDL